MTVGPTRSLRARALQLLAQREHRRSSCGASCWTTCAAGGAAVGRRHHLVAGELVPAVTPEGKARRSTRCWPGCGEGHLSEARARRSRVRTARAARYGNLRIRHGARPARPEPPAADQGALAASELERARAVWARKFDGAPPADAAGLDAQNTPGPDAFSRSRVSPDVIRRVLRRRRRLTDRPPGAQGELRLPASGETIDLLPND